MKFVKLHLKNFQAYVDTTIDFIEGLNIIVGPSDTGKSSIVRALRKVIRDTPSGKDFINENATEMKLSLVIENDDGEIITITRQVTPSKNLYYLDTTEFGGFGREVPQEIQQALEMVLIKLENSDQIDLHFFDQHDGPFMVSKSMAGTRSKLFGRIAGLHVLDKSIIDVNRDIRAGNNALKIQAMDRDKLQQKIDAFPDLTSYHQLYATLEKCVQTLEMKDTRLNVLKDINKNFKEVCDKGKKQKELFNSLPNIEVDFQKLYGDLRILNRLQELYVKLTNTNSEIEKLDRAILPEISVDFSCIMDRMQTVKKVQNLADELSRISRQVEVLSGKEFDIIIQEAQQEYTTLLRGLKVCPVCKQSTEHIKEYHG